jgi:hypothetical protein
MDFRSRQQLTRGLKPLKQALAAHRRSLALLESALVEFEEGFNQAEQRPGRPQVQQTTSSGETIELLRIKDTGSYV